MVVKAIRKTIRKTRLRHKISIAIVGMVVFFMVLSAALFYHFASGLVIESERQISTDMTRQLTRLLDGKLRTILERIFAFLNNPQFYETLRDFLQTESPESLSRAITIIPDSLYEIRTSDPIISTLYIKSSKLVLHDYTAPPMRQVDFYTTGLYRQAQETLVQRMYWGYAQKNELFDVEGESIPLVIRYPLSSTNEYIYFVLHIDAARLLSYIRGYHIGDYLSVIVDDAGNKVVADTSPVAQEVMAGIAGGAVGNSTGSGSAMTDIGGEKTLINWDLTRTAPWKVISIKSFAFLTRNLGNLGIYVLLLTLGCLVLALVFAVLVASRITGPLMEMEQRIIRVSEENFTVRFDYDHQDEIGQLGRSFNFMVDRIGNLVTRLNQTISELEDEREKVREEQMRKRQAELIALQAQINPHFLYNTLNTIIWMAGRDKVPEIGRLADTLGTFFRLSLSRGMEMIPLRDEMAHVDAYMSIQKIRYGEKLNFTVSVEAGLENAVIVKLVVQPLVENAIYHGIKEKAGSGSIELEVMQREEGDNRVLVITVSDDGRGIPPRLLELINRRLLLGESSGTEGYGIYNVNERIRLAFGQRYGLRLESVQDVYARSILTLPLVFDTNRETTGTAAETEKAPADAPNAQNESNGEKKTGYA